MKSNDRLKVVATLETHIVLRCVFQFSGVVIGIIHAYFHAPNKWIYVAISTLWLKTVMLRNLPHCFLLTCFSNTCFLPMAYSWDLCVSCNACSGKQRCSTSWRFETVGGPHVCAPCGESNQVCLATRKRCASACIAEQETQGSAAQAFLHRWTSIFCNPEQANTSDARHTWFRESVEKTLGSFWNHIMKHCKVSYALHNRMWFHRVPPIVQWEHCKMWKTYTANWL